MQSLNDDIEDLFRRAAEEYPLNSDGADWDKVMQLLHQQEGDLPKEVPRKKDYRYLWLVFLLPIGFVCGRYVGNDKKIAIVETNNGVSIPSALPGSSRPTASAPGVPTVKPKGNDRREQAVTANEETAAKESELNNSREMSPKRSDISKQAALKLIRPAGDRTAFTTNAVTKSRKKISKNLPSDKLPMQVPSNLVIENKKDTLTQGDGDKPTAIIKELSDQPSTSSPGNANEKDSAKTLQASPITVSPRESKNKKPNTFKKTFSYAIVAGPDISTIKYQKTSSIGYNLGFMLRYEFAKKISVEAGVLWARKNYYTSGEYLDTSLLKLPSHSNVKTVSGYCNMIEIPLNIRYDFSANQRRTWFVSGGLSSYLMSQEDYNITYVRYNMPYAKDYEYMRSTKDWFSIMNLSIGYQKSLSKRTNISVAPYVKLPLRGIGIGKLPVSSTGLFLSLSRSFK